jgi:HK97 family phage prohead protease
MPWHVGRTDACPASKPFGVIKDDDGSVDGRCHETREGAQRQMSALYAAEDQAARLAGGTFVRSFPLEDIAIRAGTGRLVEAYAAIFGQEAEVSDVQGSYVEVIERSAFNKAVNDARPQGSRANWNVGVFYNHAMTIYGTPSERFSVPIGTPEDIKVTDRGLLTLTRFNATPQAEEILEAIRAGSINGMSFTGRFITSDPARPPRGGFRRSAAGSFPTVRRLELGLKEYGPTPIPVYAGASVVGVRALLAGATDDDLRALRALLSATPDVEPDEADEAPEGTDTPDDGAVTDEPPPDGHSSRSQLLQRIAAAKTTRPGLARTPAADHRAARVAALARPEGGSR